MDSPIQEVFDDLEDMWLNVVIDRSPHMYDNLGLIKNIGTNLKMVADGLGLDVDVRTPID